MAVPPRRAARHTGTLGWLCFCFKDDPAPQVTRVPNPENDIQLHGAHRGQSQPASSAHNRPRSSIPRISGLPLAPDRDSEHRHTDTPTRPRRRNSRLGDPPHRRDANFRQSVRFDAAVEFTVAHDQVEAQVASAPRAAQYKVCCPWTSADVAVRDTQPTGSDKLQYRFLCPICFKYMDSTLDSRQRCCSSNAARTTFASDASQT